jgi:hypothetical protein
MMSQFIATWPSTCVYNFRVVFERLQRTYITVNVFNDEFRHVVHGAGVVYKLFGSGSVLCWVICCFWPERWAFVQRYDIVRVPVKIPAPETRRQWTLPWIKFSIDIDELSVRLPTTENTTVLGRGS